MQPPNFSLVIVMVCFWLTFWLVQKFLLKPVGAVLAERSRRIDGAENEWQSKHQEYLDETARLETELEEAAKAAAKVRNDYQQKALDRRQATLDARRGSWPTDGSTRPWMSCRPTPRPPAPIFNRGLGNWPGSSPSQLLGREVSQ